MKKSKLILLPLLLLGSVSGLNAMTSCIHVNNDSVTLSFKEDTPDSVYVGSSLDLSEAYTIEATGAYTTDVTWSSSDEAVATVDSEGFVNGVSAGEATITVASVSDPEVKAELLVTVSVKPLPTPVAKTIAELNAMTASDTTNLYEVSGVVTGIVNTDYGNFYLNTADGSERIQVYGSTVTESAIGWNATCSKLQFTNPKDFRAEGGLYSNLHNGDRVTIVGLFVFYNTTTEITGYVKNGLEGIDSRENHKDYTASVTTTKVSEDGTDATLSKTEGIYFGEEITVTVPSVTDYNAVVKVNGTELTANDGVYKFNAGFENVVTVSYEEAVTTKTLSYDRASFFDDSSAAIECAGWTVSGLTDQLSYSEWSVAKSTGSMAFDLSTAVEDGSYIKKLTINFYNYVNCAVYAGTSAEGTLNEGTKGTKDSTTKSQPVVYEFGEGVTQIYIANTSSYANSIFSIEVVYVPAE